MRRFSRPVIVGSTAAYCPARPMIRRTRSGWRATSIPATRSRPASGRTSVATERTKVVFPAPLGPRTAVTCPPRHEVEPRQRLDLAETLDQALGLDDRFRHRASPRCRCYAGGFRSVTLMTEGGRGR
ncbi:Uncharacterised protein [Actinomadura madurae]|nr:Uncharacterised protein [Actinomadura madurae]